MRPLDASQFASEWPLFTVAFSVSVAFYFAQGGAPPVPRLLSSLHGLLAALALFYAVVAGSFTWDPGMPHTLVARVSLPFYLSLAGAVVSMVLSFPVVRGHRRVLVLHVFTIPLIVLVWLVGGMTISHLSL